MSRYLLGMDEAAVRPPLAAQDAAEAKIALGWRITPDGPCMGVGGSAIW